MRKRKNAHRSFSLLLPVFVAASSVLPAATAALHAQTIDISGQTNLALGKSCRTGLNTKEAAAMTDGSADTAWTGYYYPVYADVDLGENVDLDQIQVSLPHEKGEYYYYTVYGSTDYVSFERLYQKRTDTPATSQGDLIDAAGQRCRFIRVYLEYSSQSKTAEIREIAVTGTPTGENSGDLRTGTVEEELNLKPFDQTEYAAEITEDETIENVYGIVDRTVGESYRSWFEFSLCQSRSDGKDYYKLEMKDGKVAVCGNSGLSLASGLNYYYKNYAGVNITEQARQTRMPEDIVPVNQPVEVVSPYKYRYAFNYCTLDYSYVFYDEEDWQKENDYLALNGVNLVLDLAGQEAVWIQFLKNFGYSIDDAKDWLAGPSYYAWQFMDNMENFGGPVSDGWVRDRLDMARSTQRWKRSLGMNTVLQGYAGMIPKNFREFQPDAEILDQGTWYANVDRPDMIRTDGAAYDDYAKKFYDAQKWAFGDTSNYFAVDVFHEGGIRPEDLSDEVIGAEVMESMRQANDNAVWVVQRWGENPTKGLLTGIGEQRKDHALVLDLIAYDYPQTHISNDPNAGSYDEFMGTDWIWCMLKNYGGNPSMDGNISKVASGIPQALVDNEYMAGIGVISEAMNDNPLIHNMLFDMAWQTEALDVDQWLASYLSARYGARSDSARQAWELLRNSNYNVEKGGMILGDMVQILSRTPQLYKNRTVPYDAKSLYDALVLLENDYDLLKDSPGYLYDLQELMRQHVSNFALSSVNKMTDAFEKKNLEEFQTQKNNILSAFDLAIQIQQIDADQMIGQWIGRAQDWGARYDDFSMDSLTMNAKALITTWIGPSSGIVEYATRNYDGLLRDVYKPEWSAFLDHLEKQLKNEATSYSLNHTDNLWQWNMKTPEYSRTPNTDRQSVHSLLSAVIAQTQLTESDLKINPADPFSPANICLRKPVEAKIAAEGTKASNVTDGNLSSNWDGGSWSASPEIIVSLKSLYALDSVTVVNYVDGTRYYQFDVYASVDRENWTRIGSKSDSTVAMENGTTLRPDQPVEARYIKVVGKYNSANPGFHIREILATGTLITDEENAALGRPVTTSGDFEGTRGELITDGKTDTGWWDGGDCTNRPEAIVDLGADYLINRFRVVNMSDFGDKRAYTYEIYTSANGSEWSLACAKTDDSPADEYGDTLYLDEVIRARYVRLVGTGNSKVASFHVKEFAAYGDPALAQYPNIAQSKPVSASREADGTRAERINDGNTDSYWDGGDCTDRPQAVIDLGGNCFLNRINVVNYHADSRSYQYELQISDDQDTWQTIAVKDNEQPATASGDDYVFEEGLQTRYIRIIGVNNSSGTSFHVCELRAYGKELVEENIALNKAVETTENGDGTKAESINDGSLSSYWDGGDCDQQPQAIIDLGGLYDLTSVNVVNYFDGVRGYQYEVHVSKDGQTWTLAGEKKNDAIASAAGDTYSLDRTTARYIRITGLKNTHGRTFHVIELKATGTVHIRPNLALNKSASAQVIADGTKIGSINDDNLSTYWDGGDCSALPEAVIDLEKTYLLDTLNVVNYYDGSRGYHYILSVSEDGLTWTEAARKETDSAATEEGDTFGLEQPLRARYVKVTGLKNTHGQTFHVKELRAFGQEAPIIKDILGARIKEFTALSEERYTPLSWQNAHEKAQNAQTVLDNADASQSEIDAAADALGLAMDALKERADFSALEDRIESCAALSADEYMDAGWQSLSDALETARETASDLNADQTVVDQALTALNQAVDALVFKADRSELQNAYDSCANFEVSQYLADGWDAFEQARTALKALLEAEEVSRADGQDVIRRLEEARNALIAKGDKTELNTLLETLETMDFTDTVHDENWTAFQDALKTAREVVLDEQADQSTVDAALETLQQARQKLTVSSRTELRALLAEYGQIDEKTISHDEAYIAFSTQMEQARAMAEGPAPIQSEIDRMIESLKETRNSLSLLDRTLLSAALEYSGRLDLEKFESIETAQSAIRQARETLEESLDQSEIDRAASALNRALLALRRQPLSSSLKELQ